MRQNTVNQGARHRLVKLVARLHRGEPVTARYIKDAYGVSWATAKRDVQALTEWLPVSVAKIELRGFAVRHELRLQEAA